MVNRREGGEFFHFVKFLLAYKILHVRCTFFFFGLVLIGTYLFHVCAYTVDVMSDEIMNHDVDLTMCPQMNVVVFDNQWTCLLCKWFNKGENLMLCICSVWRFRILQFPKK